MSIEQVVRVVFDDNALMHMGCGSMGSTSSAAATVETLHRDGEGGEPAAFVVSLNLHRRHLSESQRAMVAAKLADMPVGTNQHAPIGAPSQDEAADMLNVGRRSVQRAREVINEAFREYVGDPTLRAPIVGIVSAPVG